MMVRIRSALVLAGVVFAVATGAAQVPLSEEQVVTQFQRAADSYAFGHRQTERRGVTVRPAQEGALFTPPAAALFRSRIRAATARGCVVAAASGLVPRVNGGIEGTAIVPPCIAAVLPRLPEELEYRSGGIALVLVDAHLSVVVDVLHAAFPESIAP